jgi:hypothetical protein
VVRRGGGYCVLVGGGGGEVGRCGVSFMALPCGCTRLSATRPLTWLIRYFTFPYRDDTSIRARLVQ